MDFNSLQSLGAELLCLEYSPVITLGITTGKLTIIVSFPVVIPSVLGNKIIAKDTTELTTFGAKATLTAITVHYMKY